MANKLQAQQQNQFPQVQFQNAPQGSFWEQLGQFFTGKPEQFGTMNKFNPQQQDAFSKILQQALGGLQNPTAGFAPIEQQARSQFQTKTIPGLAERFTALGGGQNSSAFQGALGSAASDLEQGLASLKSQYGLKQQGLLQNLLSLGLQPQNETFHSQRNPGAIEGGVNSLAKLLPLLAFL